MKYNFESDYRNCEWTPANRLKSKLDYFCDGMYSEDEKENVKNQIDILCNVMNEEPLKLLDVLIYMKERKEKDKIFFDRLFS